MAKGQSLQDPFLNALRHPEGEVASRRVTGENDPVRIQGESICEFQQAGVSRFDIIERSGPGASRITDAPIFE